MALEQVLGNVACWDDIGFEDVQQVALKLKDGVELPVLNQLSKKDIAAYQAL